MKHLLNITLTFIFGACASFVAHAQIIDTSSDVSTVLKTNFTLASSESNVANHLYDYLNIETSSETLYGFTGEMKSFEGGFCVKRTNNVHAITEKRCYMELEEINFEELYDALHIQSTETLNGTNKVNTKNIPNLISCTKSTSTLSDSNTIYKCSFENCKVNLGLDKLVTAKKTYLSKKTGVTCKFGLD